MWPLTFVGIAIVLVAAIGRRAGSAFLVGFLAGLSFYLVHVSWTALYLGPVPWVALSVLESLFFGLGTVLITLAYRWFPRVWRGPTARLAVLPVLVGALWTAREGLVSTWPYGGFAWGRVALSQSESPFAPLVAWIGISGLSFVMVAIVALGVQVLSEPSPGLVRRLAVPSVVIVAVLAVPAWPTSEFGMSRIAAVQGNIKAGYFDAAEREPGELLLGQLDASLSVVGEGADMIVWPEGSSEYDPAVDAGAARSLDALSELSGGAPIILGAIQERGDEVFNTSMLWQNGGVEDWYDKKHPIPFGEYVPDRAFWRPFAPELIDLIGRDYTPGTRDGVIDVNGVITGISICFDIVDDAVMRDSVDRGAQVLLAQTNNADFGTTDENQQQLAITRLRAIETSRSVVSISTVGLSAIIGPRGETIATVPAYEPGALVEDVPLSRGLTPAVLLGGQIEGLVVGWGIGTLLVSGLLARRRQG
ncbi:apolipoprotein N-acyltransferase [Labedella populi]|uniref:Apolipoprotein N-acyltransferase n=2 Tax=Labedella populi TaxID=2498850 RepID=A0A444QC60_9MICO|nr:apolipoprotein N-acyltransferase [Labedella populi]